MNSLAWIGIIVWGLFITGFGFANVAPPDAAALDAAAGVAAEVAAHDVIFLIAGGLLTCLIGCAGLLGFMGWMPGLKQRAVRPYDV